MEELRAAPERIDGEPIPPPLDDHEQGIEVNASALRESVSFPSKHREVVRLTQGIGQPLGLSHESSELPRPRRLQHLQGITQILDLLAPFMH